MISIYNVNVCWLRAVKILGLEAAWLGSVNLEKIRTDAEDAYVDKCCATLSPFREGKIIKPATMWAIFGAANGLAYPISCGKIA
jgi:hypothetical protein